MASPLLVVLDTSVLFSYVLGQERRYAVRDAVLDGELVSVACASTLAELRDVSLRHVDAGRLAAFWDDFMQSVRVVADPPVRFVHHTDPKDSVFFNLAIETGAEFLVSYDKAHILAVQEASHPQHDELQKLAPNLRLLQPIEMAQELAVRRTRSK